MPHESHYWIVTQGRHGSGAAWARCQRPLLANEIATPSWPERGTHRIDA